MEKITLDGVEYEYDSLSEKAQYFVTQLKDLQQKIEKTKLEIGQLEVTIGAFTQLLSEEINPSDEFVAE